MNAIRDENGEMVAHDRITASYVTARFRNVAERHGKVDIAFDVRVPAQMLDSRWQLSNTIPGETESRNSGVVEEAEP